jgi:hypothetical protein
MSYVSRRGRTPALAFVFLLAAGSCTDAVDPTSVTDVLASHSMHGRAGAAAAHEGARASINHSLAELRAAVARFHRLEAAMDAGWTELLTPCLENPPEGGMGFHYGNPALIDGEVSLLEPEALLYAPWPNGDVRFVAVEYLVPIQAWTDDEPPQLLGHEFHVVEEAGIWALHIWLWQHNPSGMFADWNPRISC